MADSWVSLAIQSAGAVAVCGMFLWYLNGKKGQDESARESFLSHLKEKDTMHAESVDRLMTYVQGRDAQSKEIAQSGHDALRELSTEVAGLREEIRARIT